jgi:hypothetical protein
MTRCIETSRKMQQAYPEFGDATNPDSRGAADCGPSARSKPRFHSRSCTLEFAHFRRLTCVVRSELRLVCRQEATI